MADAVLIREALPDDAARLREIYLLSRRETFHWNPPSRYALQDFDKDTEGEAVFVAEVGGFIAGFISVWEPESFVHHLYVDTEFKRRGVGKALLSHVLQRFPRPARLKCVVRNHAAVEFYRSQGWVSVETAVGDDGEFFLMQSPG